MIRREFLLPPQAVDDEIYVKTREGVDRVRQLIGYACRRQRETGEALELPPLGDLPLHRREFFISERASDDANFVRDQWGVDYLRSLLAWVFRKQRKEMEAKEHGSSAGTKKAPRGNAIRNTPKR